MAQASPRYMMRLRGTPAQNTPASHIACNVGRAQDYVADRSVLVPAGSSLLGYSVSSVSDQRTNHARCRWQSRRRGGWRVVGIYQTVFVSRYEPITIDACTANEPRPTNRRPENGANRLPYRVVIQANINKLVQQLFEQGFHRFRPDLIALARGVYQIAQQGLVRHVVPP